MSSGPAEPIAARLSIPDLERWLGKAERASERAMEARAALPTGSSRARVTGANARWAAHAEARDRLTRWLDDARRLLAFLESSRSNLIAETNLPNEAPNARQRRAIARQALKSLDRRVAILRGEIRP